MTIGAGIRYIGPEHIISDKVIPLKVCNFTVKNLIDTSLYHINILNLYKNVLLFFNKIILSIFLDIS